MQQEEGEGDVKREVGIKEWCRRRARMAFGPTFAVFGCDQEEEGGCFEEEEEVEHEAEEGGEEEEEEAEGG